MSRKSAIQAALSTAKAALSAPPNDPNHIGDLVWCDPVSGWRMKAAAVQAAFTAAGLDPVVLLPPTPDYQVAFSRAILQVRTMIQGRGYTLLAAAPGPSGESRYSVVKVHRNTSVTTEDTATVRCPKDDTRPFVEKTTQDKDADAILQMIMIAVDSYYETYTSDDARQAFVRQVDMYAGLPCRYSPPHVVYWISPQGSKAVQQVADVLQSLGWGSVAVFEGTRNSARSTQAVVTAVNSGLESKLSEFAEEAKKYAEDFQGMRPSTISKRIEEAKNLRAQAELYRTVLGAAVESVDSKIAQVEKSLRHTLGLIEGEPPQMSSAPPSARKGTASKELTQVDCHKRADWERNEARMAREAGNEVKAQAHDKKAVAYDLMAEAVA